MWDWIEKNRKKSRAERSRLTLVLTVAFTGVIVLVWSTVILPRTLSTNSQDSSQANGSTPFKTLSESLGVIIEDAQKGFGMVREALQSEDSLGISEEAVGGENSAGSTGDLPDVGGEVDVDVLETETEEGVPASTSESEDESLGNEEVGGDF